MHRLRVSMAFVWLIVAMGPVVAQDSSQEQPSAFEQTVKNINWTMGPAELRVGSVGTIQLPEGFAGAGPSDTKRFLRALGNIASDELAMVCPETLGWWIDFAFEPCGYVKDDEKDDLDASAILEQLRKNQEEANKVRRSRGLGELEITGWAMKPYYDEGLHSLAWAITLKEPGGESSVNFSVRLLGRRGVVHGTYVSTLDDFRENLYAAKSLLKGFRFVPGQTYSDFRKGDKIAEYGLGALIAGGGLAIAAKTGLLKSLWKIIVGVFVAISAFFRRIFGGKSSSRRRSGGRRGRGGTGRRTSRRGPPSRIARGGAADVVDEE